MENKRLVIIFGFVLLIFWSIVLSIVLFPDKRTTEQKKNDAYYSCVNSLSKSAEGIGNCNLIK